MRRRGLLGALSAGLIGTSGCLTDVETPRLGGGGDRPELSREDYVSSEDADPRETMVPSVSMLSVSTAGGVDESHHSRSVQPPGTDTGGTNTSTTKPTGKTGGESGGEDDVAVPDRDFEKQGLYVTDDFWRHRTHIHRYNADEVTTTVYPLEPSNEVSVKVVVAAYVYPRGAVIDSETSDSFRPTDEAKDVTISMSLADAPDGVPLQYVAAVIPEGVRPDEMTRTDLHAIMETDPFIVTGDSIVRAEQPKTLDEGSGPAFERRRVEGGYVQTIRGRLQGQDWEVSYLAFDSAYAAARRRSRGRARAEYVSFELLEGAANEIARFLSTAAESNGFTTDFERIQFALSFVQRLPYVPDNVSKGYDDYTQFIMETLTELRGDCEDTSILFASILEAKPFNYDAVLLEPPGHMGVGLLIAEEFDGFAYRYGGRKYYYVETTTEGWGIGQIPDQYRDKTAQVYDV